jgi:rhomboid protease GluP
MTIFACVIGLFRARSPVLFKPTDWQIVHLLTLAAVLMAWRLSPDTAGYWSLSVWGVLFLAPLLGVKLTRHCEMRQRYGAAKRLARICVALHPFPCWRGFPQSIEVSRLVAAGEVESALALLNSERGLFGGSIAVLQGFSLSGEWAKLRSWIEVRRCGGKDIQDLELIPWYLRSLGEAGELNLLVNEFKRQRDVLARFCQGSHLQMARLMLFGFGGCPAQQDRLVHGYLRGLPQDIKRFWVMTAELAAGNAEQALPEFERLSATTNVVVQRAARRRLAQGLVEAGRVLGGEERRLLYEEAARFERDDRLHDRLGRSRRRSKMTLILTVMLAAVFVLQWLFGPTTDVNNIIAMGGLQPRLVLRDWRYAWTIFSAIFLHYNLLHLCMNILALFIIGPIVERLFGTWRYVLGYLVSGFGSMLLLVGLSARGMLGDDLVLGASGAIMGLVGISLAAFWRLWRRDRVEFALRQMQALAMIVLLQVAFDLMTPEVSVGAHLGGALIGLALGVAMKDRAE